MAAAPGGVGAGGEGTVRAYGGGTCSQQKTCGIASRGEETFELEPFTRYACCV